MKDFHTACEWFYQYNGTFLSPEAAQMIQSIDADLGISSWKIPPACAVSEDQKAELDIEKAIEQFVQYVENEKTAHPEQYPEAMVRLGRYFYYKGKSVIKKAPIEEPDSDESLFREMPDNLAPLEKALNALGVAAVYYQDLQAMRPSTINGYNPELLRAIVLWMMGQVSLLMFDTKFAYDVWQKAIEGFGKIAKYSGQHYLPEQGAFAGEKLVEMRKEIFCLPEKAYSWLDDKKLPWSCEYGGGNHMNEPTLELKKILIQRQESGKYREVYADLEKFHKISKESVHGLYLKMVYGEADALVVSGMLLFWMGNIEGAREKINKAADVYLPDTHSKAVSYWILGLMYLFVPNDKSKVVAYCQRAIQGFKRIKFTADRDHHQTAFDWYTDKINLMKLTLEMIMKDELFQ